MCRHLDEIKARRERVNGASWKAVEGNSNDIRSSVFAGNDLLATLSSWKRHEYADFIANAPTDIDWLVGEVERLREALKAIDETLTIEINPNNYNESNVLELNNQAIEISAIVSGALQEHPNDHD